MRARAMTAAQPPSERTPIQKIAARIESRSARLRSGTRVASGVEISACGSLGIVRLLPADSTEMRPVLGQGPAAGEPGAGGGSPGRLTKDAYPAFANRFRGREDRSHEDYHRNQHGAAGRASQ